ncbi:MAG: NAD(P)H-binding protein [Gammaproteobacteria bacterium]|nr:NAD(P)H-binding protein [Gammaproteobacteria bacterium]
MKVAIIGGTGFVGHYITQKLIQEKIKPSLLVRSGSDKKIENTHEIEIIHGDVDDSIAMTKLMEGADVAIFLIGILREFPQLGITFEKLQYQAAKLAIDVAIKAKVSKFILMSANGVKADGTNYQQSKFKAEEYLKATDLNWTIFRPSVLFGHPQGRMEFATQLNKEIIQMPLPAPLFFDNFTIKSAGQFQMSPAFVGDVADAFVKAILENQTTGQTYSLCGPDNLSWKQILTTIAQAVNTKKLMIPAPTWGVKSAALFLERFKFFPITRDQITMLMEGNICSNDNGFKALGIKPKPFNIETLDYLK